jgi:hypothetical protein
VIIDAVDEAASPSQAREVIDSVALPLAETCSDAGVQVVVGTRRRDDGGDLLSRFGFGLDMLDLDNPGYFAEQDLAAYALACLQLAGGERLASPYTDHRVAVPLAARIAEVSGQNFLIAGLIGRSHGLYDGEAADPGRLGSGATVDSALPGYLQRLSPVAGLPAADLLTALAFAEAPGLPAGLWQLAVETLYGSHVSTGDLAEFARSSAAGFLVETAGRTAHAPHDPGAGPVYRLFHQALNDALLHARAEITSRADDERGLVRAFTTDGRASQWNSVPEYLLRSLSGHAQAGELVDGLLTDDAYLLHADLRRLMQAADHATSAAGRRRARLLRFTPQAITAGPGERAALFSVTEALADLGTTYRTDGWQAPYRAQWAAAKPRSEHAARQGHQAAVRAVRIVTVGGRDLLASGSIDRTVRLWDPRTGEQHAVLNGHQGWVNAVCAVAVGGCDLLASGSDDSTVRLWDPQTGEQHAVLDGHQGWVNAVCGITVGGRDLLASGSDDGTVRLWDPQTGPCLLTVPTRYRRALGMTWMTGSLVIGLDTGILVIQPHDVAFPSTSNELVCRHGCGPRANQLAGRVSADTLRRWADGGRIETVTDASGRLAVDGAELARLAQELAAKANVSVEIPQSS